MLNIVSHSLKNMIFEEHWSSVIYWLRSRHQNVFLSLFARRNMLRSLVSLSRGFGWFYNKLIKGRNLSWPHALLLVDERHKEWRWSQGVSLYGGSVRRLSLKRAFEPHQVVARWWIAITGLTGKRLVRFILILHHLFIHHED